MLLSPALSTLFGACAPSRRYPPTRTVGSRRTANAGETRGHTRCLRRSLFRARGALANQGGPYRVNPYLQPLNVLVFTHKVFFSMHSVAPMRCIGWLAEQAQAQPSCPGVLTKGSLVRGRAGTNVLFFHKCRVGQFRNSRIRLELLQRRH